MIGCDSPWKRERELISARGLAEVLLSWLRSGHR